MNCKCKSIPGGTITTPRGFVAGAVCAGLRSEGKDKLDLAILYSEVPCAAAAVFTGNEIKAAPIYVCQRHLADGSVRAVVVNAGYANACTGEQGLEDAANMAALAATKLGIFAEEVLVASTGVIGALLPMDTISSGIDAITLSADGGHELATAITTTDTKQKEIAVKLEVGITIAGVAKGAGMIHPNMGTMLAFLTTDAAVEPSFLKAALKESADISFNMITIDGDTSPNDTLIILANGLAANETIAAGHALAPYFQAGLNHVCIYLAKCIAADGEGATKLIEVAVRGAKSLSDARIAARSVAGSPLVKAAVYGSDPNWGRIIAAIGRSGAAIDGSTVDLYLGNGICLMKAGRPQPFDEGEARAVMGEKEVSFSVNLNLGNASATAWGCDLTEEYVIINSAYTT